MNESKHREGDWQIIGRSIGGHTIIVGVPVNPNKKFKNQAAHADAFEENTIADVVGRTREEREANANLISAARDMFIALQAEAAADEHANDCEECHDDENAGGCEKWAELDIKASRLRAAAITKATGQP